MSVDRKDEYATLRQEMLERFERIHDTAKYGIGAFIAFISFYLAYSDFDNIVALLIMLSIVTLMALSALNNYQLIYTQGTYIAVIVEEGSDAKWHRMSRSYDDYLNKLRKMTWWEKWPFPIGLRWGADSTQFSYLAIALTFLSFGAVYLKTSFQAFTPSDLAHCFFFVFICFLFVTNVILIYKLSWGMQNFRKKTENRWKDYRENFGKKFEDFYKSCP